MVRAFLTGVVVAVGCLPMAGAQLPAEAINLAKVKISERQTAIDLCPVHLVEADPDLPSWTFKSVEYRGHTPACRSEFEKAPDRYAETARYKRWENNFIADMSTVWCPVTDEVAGGFLKWERLGLKWESCCRFCNATVSENHFPVALERLKRRARQAYELTGGDYAVGARDPLEGAVFGRGSGRESSATTLRPGQVPDGVEPGLLLTLTSIDTDESDARVARLPALRVEAGATPSPFLEAGPFRAEWAGYLRLDHDDQLRFSAAGRGAVRLRVAGKSALAGSGESLTRVGSPSVQLAAGYHAFELEYVAPRSGAAWLRLYWDGAAFGRETVPPTVLSHRASELSLVHGKRVRRGRALFAAYLCMRCHEAEDEWALNDSSMPELRAAAPSLEGIGSRLHRNWLTHWISRPRNLRPGARMPGVLNQDDAAQAIRDGDRRAADIAAYLSTLTDPRFVNESRGADSTTELNGRIQRGEELFSTIGCSRCHAPCEADDGGTARSSPAVPLSLLREKWKPGALRAFLRAPGTHHRWTRMPDFRLLGEEAEQLTAYLLRERPAKRLERLPVGDPATGRRLVATLGCLNCHPAPLENQFETKSLGDLEGLDWDLWGCVASGDGRGDAPAFEFPDVEKAALLAFGATDLSSLGRTVPAEFWERQYRELHCGACHERDGRPADCVTAGDTAAASTESIRDRLLASRKPPPLTYVGEQLRTPWLEELLAGRSGHIRPWLELRMPSFPLRASLLAAGLAADHGLGTRVESGRADAPAAAFLAAGEKLFGSDGGLSCSKCHSLGARKAQMDVEFGVIDLLRSRDRLRVEFYLRWMMNPTRVLPGTQMPTYTDAEGNSPLVHVLGGDGRRQFEAIWQFMAALEGR